METSDFGKNYTPRPWQSWVHSRAKRFNVFNVHRRGGKTILAIAELRDRAVRNGKKNPQYVYLAPTYSQAKKIAWEYVKEFFRHIPGAVFKEGELKLEIPRPEHGDKISVWLVSAENPDSMRGLYLDGIILDEFSEINPTIWTLTVRPALSDRKGWAIFIGTPRGRDHFYDIYRRAEHLMKAGEDWFCASLTVDHTNAIDPRELEEAKQTMTKDEIAQEFYCSFTAPLTGAYWSELMEQASQEGRICDLPYNPAYNVATSWDLGISDSMSIFFIQKIPGQSYYHIIDYLEYDGKGIDFYIQELHKKAYSYGTHLLPHDAKQREFSTGKSRMDTFTKKGLRPIEIVPKVGNIADAIHAVREILPLCKFDKKKCDAGINALRSYQREYDHKKKMFRDKPDHNWASHAASAFQTFARGVRPQHFLLGSERYQDLPTVAITDYNEYDY